MSERLTRGQLAEKHNVSRQRIDELVNEGRLHEERATIDSDEADKVFADMDPSYVARERASRDSGKQPNPEVATYAKAKAAEQVMKARKAELDFKIKSGQYVEREKIKRSSFEAGKVFASKCGNFANRVAPLLAGLKDVRSIHEVLGAEMATLVQEIRDELAGIG